MNSSNDGSRVESRRVAHWVALSRAGNACNLPQLKVAAAADGTRLPPHAAPPPAALLLLPPPPWWAEERCAAMMFFMAALLCFAAPLLVGCRCNRHRRPALSLAHTHTYTHRAERVRASVCLADSCASSNWSHFCFAYNTSRAPRSTPWAGTIWLTHTALLPSSLANPYPLARCSALPLQHSPAVRTSLVTLQL